MKFSQLNMKDKVFCIVVIVMLIISGYYILRENTGEKQAKEIIRHGDITFYEYR